MLVFQFPLPVSSNIYVFGDTKFLPMPCIHWHQG